jgi:hypothetical protein
MSAPSRRPEIRRRRTRAEKVAKLRKRLAAASTSNDKDRLTAKLHRVGFVYPGNPVVKTA